MPPLKGSSGKLFRLEFFYYGEHDLFAIRHNNWKTHFLIKGRSACLAWLPSWGNEKGRHKRAALPQSGVPRALPLAEPEAEPRL